MRIAIPSRAACACTSISGYGSHGSTPSSSSSSRRRSPLCPRQVRAYRRAGSTHLGCGVLAYYQEPTPYHDGGCDAPQRHDIHEHSMPGGESLLRTNTRASAEPSSGSCRSRVSGGAIRLRGTRTTSAPLLSFGRHSTAGRAARWSVRTRRSCAGRSIEGWRGEPAELALDERGEADRSAVPVHWSDCL